MRYTIIDAHMVEVKSCDECPFFSTEMELAGYCKYPVRPSHFGGGFNCFQEDIYDKVRSDCPLKTSEGE